MLLVLCGPTATGKSAAAIALARRVGGEVVNADSRNVYRGLDIGTAKPTPAERAGVPHHLFDVADPREVFTVADYQRLALAAIEAIHARGRLPILVGGTGLYIRAVVDRLTIPAVPPDPAFRLAAEAEEAAHPGTLHARLQGLDPAAAARIHPRNVRRLVRALEVIHHTGRPLSAQQGRRGAPEPVLQVGLRLPRPVLDARIDRRVEAQLAAGLVEEVRGLLAAGVPPTTPAMQGLGYKELIPYLEGRLPLDRAVALLKRNTRRYARRQEIWFRADPRIRWLDVEGLDAEAVAERVHAMLAAFAAAPSWGGVPARPDAGRRVT
ncbi:MAG: tRNA (adenosine(37)-N6)-dimethylallyltransferase MiaA [Armatimonadota bacterium]|nr:tRNA (adenosine(37)-N6)-dimethylallyltransferase MiaA [Armatimonadota bacterium]MDR7448355.1 tRNA (adenosine(37)-N6)-dimethylallyltransferase MiaA [Armatimonadota bacterium]MDR7459756.1 tRNA (adenosine(37)-N6)-dimethylallyltransferase MiaA [Armatimonadota bacterium]MDR7479281.1 tRNA (adenosine(37)-N6)-dimethylallyltransferase MiaA [Armatimonadota bacterium]MDR7489058.1 tRNA (adenosine(37)-N6)-dimethylallyltransferase MiaA [Armatimonadota bacterium]